MTSLVCPTSGLPVPAQAASEKVDCKTFFVADARTHRVDESLDIDDFVAQLEADKGVRDDLVAARQWLAEEFEGVNLSLRALRLRAGLSQQQLALALGLSQPNISAFESGAREPTVKTVRKLSRALNVSTDTVIAAITNEETNV